jgi:hypothetical protein
MRLIEAQPLPKFQPCPGWCSHKRAGRLTGDDDGLRPDGRWQRVHGGKDLHPTPGTRVGWYGVDVEGVGLEFTIDLEAGQSLTPADARRLAFALIEVASTVEGLAS